MSLTSLTGRQSGGEPELYPNFSWSPLLSAAHWMWVTVMEYLSGHVLSQNMAVSPEVSLRSGPSTNGQSTREGITDSWRVICGWVGSCMLTSNLTHFWVRYCQCPIMGNACSPCLCIPLIYKTYVHWHEGICTLTCSYGILEGWKGSRMVISKTVHLKRFSFLVN